MARGGDNPLLGRDAELSVVREAVGAARGCGVALLIEGEAGIGKSALVRAAREQALRAGFAIAACCPTETESAYAYAALADLVGAPRYDTARGRLPGPQRDALARALHRDAAPPPGRDSDAEGAVERPDSDPAEGTTQGAVAAATTSLLRSLIERGPLCLIVDDAQWLDLPTEQVLRFALRRLVGPGLLVVLARRVERPGERDPLGTPAVFADHRLFRIEPGGLDTGALHTLIHADLGLSLPRSRLVELHRVTRGNPLFSLEIARLIVRRGGPPAPGEPLPLPGTLRQLLSARIASASTAAQRVLELIAVADRPTTSTMAALLGPRRAAQGLDAAVADRLVELDGSRVRAAHPMLASAAIAAMSPSRGRQLHRRLAEVESEPEARARHLALATVGAREDVSATLEAAAAAARTRGAIGTAAELLAMAVERTPPGAGTGRDRRRLLFAEALLDAGDLARAGRLADELLAGELSASCRGRAALVRAIAAWYLEPSQVAVRHLTEALAAGVGDAGSAGRLHLHLAVFLDYDLRRAREHGLAAVRLLETSLASDPSLAADPGLAGALAAALCQLFYCEVLLGMPPREELLDRALSIEPHSGRSDRSTTPGIWWAATDRPERAQARFAAQLQVSRDSGDLSGESDLLTRLAEVALFREDWAGAARFADEAIAVSQQDGRDVPEAALRARAWVDAYRGELDRAELAATSAASRLATGEGSGILAAAWLVVATLVAATRSDAVRVEELTAQSAAHLSAIGVKEGLRLDLTGERVAALCQLGRLAEAATLIDALAARHERIPRHAHAAALARGRALLAHAAGRGEDAIAVTDVAVTGDQWPAFERARTLLLRGQLQRRERDRRGARGSLLSALATFEALGARAWQAQTAAELARLGQRRPATPGLTPAEREVAALAAAGLSTREVAARLFVSPKTVETHLSHIYRKLGISSRAELGARISGGPI